MAETTYKRKNYLVNKRFQLKYTVLTVLTLLVVMFVTGFGLYMGMWGSIIENFSHFKVSQNLENVNRITDYEQVRYGKGDYRLEKIFREAELLSSQDKAALKDALRSVNRSLIPKVIILSVLIFFAGIFISHRIAGPMYRIEKSAEAIHRGDLLVNFKIRRGDEMRSAATALEEMVEGLHEDIKKIKTDSMALEERINALADKGSIPAEDGKRLKDILSGIDSVILKYKT
ncbi:MAG: methyl-accepting chemotaxis protein [Candidatus Omnitrophica bacterium]|nr:methyl-accepting chemotaxis protein [Candidatus Omnitrophota bacterium]